MEDFISYLVKNIADNPESVLVERLKEGIDNYYLTVAPEDMGKVIGKEGRIIRALRDLVRVFAVKNNLRANLVLKE